MIIKLANNLEVYVADEIKDKAKCKACKKEILWGNFVKGGKYVPLSKDKSGDYIVHFQDCPCADKFRKRIPKQYKAIRERQLEIAEEIKNS